MDRASVQCKNLWSDMAENFSVLSVETEQRPRYFEFTKNHFVGPCQGTADLGYDPYPDAKDSDVVRRELIGHEQVLIAKIKAPVGSLRPGVVLNLNGHKFALRQTTEHVNAENDTCVVDVEGFRPLDDCEQPMEVLARLRESLAKSDVSGERKSSTAAALSPERSRIMNLHLRPSFCAFLDILGFSDLIKRAYAEKKEHQLLRDIAGALSESAERIKSAAGKNSIITAKFFTDNAIVGYSYMLPGPALLHLCELVADFQLAMACRGIFVRGGIAMGTLVIDADFVFRDCLVKAHELESAAANTPRVVLDPLLKATVEQELRSSSGAWRSTWSSRLTVDTDGAFFVNYLSASYERRMIPPDVGVYFPSEETLLKHRAEVERHLKDSEACPKIWSKYFWAANYHNSFCDRLGLGVCGIDEKLLRPQPHQL